MTAQTRAVLKAKFETGDRPTGSDFEDLIDSAVNLQDTEVQIFTSNIQAPGISVSTVSADTLFATNVIYQTLSADSGVFDAIGAESVQASAVRHHNPHVVIYNTNNNADTIAYSSAYTGVSALLSAHPEGILGFTHNGSTLVTYTGAVTANMLASYNVSLLTEATSVNVTTATMMLFKNGSEEIPASRALGITGTTLQTGAGFSGKAILKLKTSDTLALGIKGDVSRTLATEIATLSLSVIPVAWDF